MSAAAWVCLCRPCGRFPAANVRHVKYVADLTAVGGIVAERDGMVRARIWGILFLHRFLDAVVIFHVRLTLRAGLAGVPLNGICI